jgi:riboflavin kinase
LINEALFKKLVLIYYSYLSNVRFISKYSFLAYMYEYLELLLYIARKGGLFGSLGSSTLKISREVGISQQSISRKLREMENKGLVKRLVSPNGLKVSLDNKGREFLQKNYRELSDVFKAKKTEITGIVQKGIEEGSYYVAQKGYQQGFKGKLGFNAFPGTLNLKIDKEELMSFLADKEVIEIGGFVTKTRSFGGLSCYKIKVGNVDGAIVKPERARHPEDIIEIVAPVNLRDSLKLKDNSKLKLS